MSARQISPPASLETLRPLPARSPDLTGQTLWADSRSTAVSFTPDGQAMVTVVDDTIDAWFLPGLALPEQTGPADVRQQARPR